MHKDVQPASAEVLVDTQYVLRQMETKEFCKPCVSINQQVLLTLKQPFLGSSFSICVCY